MKKITKNIEQIKQKGLFRRLRNVASPQEAEFILDDKKVINFSGNNSLGLATHPSIIEAARNCLDQYGMGSGASRLISGNMSPHEEVERAMADFLDREKALYFPSGFQANVGTIPAIAEKNDIILTDELNHASLIDGMRLSNAERIIYPHNDMDALQRCIEEIPVEKRVMVITEALFSMRGDRAPLEKIADLKQKRPFLLYVDEAHSFGAAGPEGRGLASEKGCNEHVDLLLGAMGKAFGISGAFISGKKEVIDLLINKARSFIYTTAPPPMMAAAAMAALHEVRKGNDLRQRLRENSTRLREIIKDILGEPPEGEDHIIPVLLYENDIVMKVCESLLERGVFCQGIRPPTVPQGQCMLRFSVSAGHTMEHIEHAGQALEEVLYKIQIKE